MLPVPEDFRLAIPVLVIAGVLLVGRIFRFRLKDALAGAEEFSGSEVVLLVDGWSRVELDHILSDFAKLYKLSTSILATRTIDHATTTVEISGPMETSILAFLVNYLAYPIGRVFEGRHAQPVAVVRSELIGAPAEMHGRRAIIYIPTDDEEYDLVYIRVDLASHFRLSFTDFRWVPTVEEREPPDLNRLVELALKLSRQRIQRSSS